MPSYIDCNRERDHEFVLPGNIRRKAVLGKANLFPVRGRRAKERSSLASEIPLLLSPYADTPEDHLEFLREGVVRPKKGSIKAEPSIEVYALNRSGLVNERYERMLFVEKSIHTIRKLALVLEKSIDSNAANIIKDLISYEMTALRAMRADGQPYALLARQVTDEYFASADGAPLQ